MNIYTVRCLGPRAMDSLKYFFPLRENWDTFLFSSPQSIIRMEGGVFRKLDVCFGLADFSECLSPTGDWIIFEGRMWPLKTRVPYPRSKLLPVLWAITASKKWTDKPRINNTNSPLRQVWSLPPLTVQLYPQPVIYCSADIAPHIHLKRISTI